MPVVRAEYQKPERLLTLVQRDIGGTVTMPLELLGAGITPTSGSVVFTDGSTAITIGAFAAGPPPSFPVAPAALVGKELSLNYEARWTLVHTGLTRTYRQRIGIVRWVPDCPVSNTTFFKSRPVLLRALQGTGHATIDPWLEDGWDDCQNWMARQGSRPHLCCDLGELYDLAEAFIACRLLSDLVLNADPQGTIALAYADWKTKLSDLQGSTHLTFDPDDTDAVVTTQRAAEAPLYLASWSGDRSCL